MNTPDTAAIDLNAMLDNARKSQTVTPGTAALTAEAPAPAAAPVAEAPVVDSAAPVAPAASAPTTEAAVDVVAAPQWVSLDTVLPGRKIEGFKHVAFSPDWHVIAGTLMFRSTNETENEIYIYKGTNRQWMERSHSEQITSIRILESGIVVHTASARYYFNSKSVVRVNLSATGTITSVENIKCEDKAADVVTSVKSTPAKMAVESVDNIKLTFQNVAVRLHKQSASLTTIEQLKEAVDKFYNDIGDINYLIKIDTDIRAVVGF